LLTNYILGYRMSHPPTERPRVNPFPAKWYKKDRRLSKPKNLSFSTINKPVEFGHNFWY